MNAILGVNAADYPLKPLIILCWLVGFVAPHDYARPNNGSRVVKPRPVYGIEGLGTVYYTRVSQSRFAIALLEIVADDGYAVVQIPKIVWSVFICTSNSLTDWTS